MRKRFFLFIAVLFVLFTSSLFAKYKWTLMIYMAADNDLEHDALIDVNEMELSGSNEDVAVVVQIERGKLYKKSLENWIGARRYLILKDKNTSKINSKLLQNLGKINSGKGSTLVNFVKYATKNFPAYKYALVIWSHGTGWQTLPAYKKSSSRKALFPKEIVVNSTSAAPDVKDAITKEIKASIAYDDTNKSAITLFDLRNSLLKIKKIIRKNIDLLGFDACLMQNIEVAYELKDCARCIVGSEETMSTLGWAYSNVINWIKKNKTADGYQFAKAIVNIHKRKYKNLRGADKALTMSAVLTSKLPAIVRATSKFAYVLLKYYSQIYETLPAIRVRVQSFANPDYIDLFHFAKLVKAAYKIPELKKAAEGVLNYDSVKTKKNKSAPFLAKGVNQARVKNAKGLSIYYPTKKNMFLSQYNPLKFAKDTYWDEFIKKNLGMRVRITKKRKRRRTKYFTFLPLFLDVANSVSVATDDDEFNKALRNASEIFDMALSYGSETDFVDFTKLISQYGENPNVWQLANLYLQKVNFMKQHEPNIFTAFSEAETNLTNYVKTYNNANKNSDFE